MIGDGDARSDNAFLAYNFHPMSPPPPMLSFCPPCLGVCWYPEQWDESRWEEDARRMVELGIRVVRVGEFSWSRLQPTADKLDFDWLRRALDILAAHQLGVVLGTPTATPPRWLLDNYPDMLLVGGDARVAAFGSRRHGCHAHLGYRRASTDITAALARAFGEHPAVIAWQIDNEYACHGTALSYSAAAAAGFRAFLKEKYGDIGALNRRWGNVFWSQEYGDFSQIEPPQATPAGHNPALLLDFYRYTSASIRCFNDEQVALVRRYSPHRAVSHNFMGFIDDFDHFALGEGLDVATWDSYPLGFLARFGEEDEQCRYLRVGHPDYAAFHHDLYRGCGRGRFWVMEQQPGPVNWAPYNPIPAAGAVRLWTWEAFAHGAEVVSYFRWRQAAAAQEQMHAGLLTVNDEKTPGFEEAAQVAQELRALPPPASVQTAAAVALVFDYAAVWQAKIQPHGDLPPARVLMDFYTALRRFGADVDIVAPAADFRKYKMVVFPLLSAPPPDLCARLQAAACVTLFGARCGGKTADFSIPAALPPGALRELLRLTVLRVESLPPTAAIPIEFTAAPAAAAVCWREVVRGEGAATVASFAGGGGAFFAAGNHHYLACRANPAMMEAVTAMLLRKAGVPVLSLPPDVRVRRCGGLRWYFNYGADSVRLPDDGDLVLSASSSSGRELPPVGVAALRVD